MSPVVSFDVEAGIHIANTIRKVEARVVSDVSFKDKRGTSAFILEGSRYNHNRISAKNTVPGNLNDHYAYMSDLAGIIHGVLIVLNITKTYHITEGETTSAFDGIDKISMALNQYSTYSCHSKTFNILT